MEKVLNHFTSILSKVNLIDHLGKLIIFVQDYSDENVTNENIMKAFCQAVGSIVPAGTPVLPRKPGSTDKEYLDNIMNAAPSMLKEYDMVISVVEPFVIPDENSKVDFVIIHVSNGLMVVDKPRLAFTDVDEMIDLVTDRYIDTIRTVEKLFISQFKELGDDKISEANLIGINMLKTILDRGPFGEFEPQAIVVSSVLEKIAASAEYSYCSNDIKGCFAVLKEISYLREEVNQDWASGSYDETDLMDTLNYLREGLGLRPYVRDEERNFVLYEEFKYIGTPDIICTFPEFKSDVIKDIVASTKASVTVMDLTIEDPNLAIVNFAGEYAPTIVVDTINPNRFLLNTNTIYLAAKDIDTGKPLYKKISRY